MDKFQKIVSDIKSIKIQGASNVAIAGLKAIKLKSKNKKELEKAIKILKSTRPTEPLLFNYLDLISKVEIKKVKEKADEYINLIKKSKKKIAEKASKLIKDGDIVFTICHSSTVIETLKKVIEGKEISVINLETRPLYQGRITSKELAKLGIKNIHIIDSAGADFISAANLVLVGADAINEKFFVNKIGTLNLAILSKLAKVKLYVLSDIMKYTKDIEIEYRNPKEVWKNAPKETIIINPAFDKVPTELCKGYVTQIGKTKPENLPKQFEDYKRRLLK